MITSGFFHGFYGKVFKPAMEIMSACKDIVAGKSLKESWEPSVPLRMA